MSALTWDDVDFKENTITINKTVNRLMQTIQGISGDICLALYLLICLIMYGMNLVFEN